MPSRDHVYIITDSVTNSVFEGQVLAPILNKLEQDTELNIILFSFEARTLTHEQKITLNNKHPRLKVKLFYRPRFWGRFTLNVCILSFRHTIRKLESYTITTRGPLAGWIALQGMSDACSNVTIQARGLLAEEYWYANSREWLKLPIHWFRYRQFKSLEQIVYGNLAKTMSNKVSIEAVSTAMKKHFIQKHNVPESLFTVAQADIPNIIPAQKVRSWHDEARHELNISQDRYIYCYAGSGKAWQCPQEIISFFIEKRKKKSESYLLILTQDTAIFSQLCKKAGLNLKDYTVMHVPHAKLFNYLSAADAGLIFREKHILNWVSRPTKILEYQSVGLKIIHNNTVEMLSHISTTS
ncbi:MAG TPA: hypothetical protein QGF02_00355 [Candidatus Babeliales bacterium]|nr:hypothetical protein [Candidatus Babeliales bacterium]